jgi:oligoribonuclease
MPLQIAWSKIFVRAELINHKGCFMSEIQDAKSRKQNLIWIDLEMTGLDPEKERIIEIAAIVTDGELNTLAEGPVIAVKQSDALLNAMDEWCTNTHTANGLIERVKASNVSEREAELQTLEFLREWVDPNQSPICGNSIGQDRRFLVKYMPELEAFFHYRNLDVSVLKELALRWNPKVLQGFEKKSTHLALDDIRESIAELKHFRKKFLIMK